MNIAIDARGINLYNGTGIGTYTQNLVKQLLITNKKYNYTLFWSGEKNYDFLDNKCNLVFCSKKHNSFFENYYIPEYTKDNFKLLHLPQNGIGLTDDYSCPCIVTIHDLIPYTMPETVGKGYLEKFLDTMPKIIKKASGIITVSEYSKKDILRFFPNFPADKIFVTPLAANSNFKPLKKDFCKKFISERYSIDEDFVLYIGGFSSRKNVEGIIQGFSNIYKSLNKKVKLVLAGSIKENGDTLKKLCLDLNMDSNIIFPGFIPDDLLPIFYNASTAFIYPSFYEGFGLPPLEAMSCGTPVITSNLTSIPEVTSDSALLINPYDLSEIESSLLQVLTDSEFRNNLGKNGLLHSKSFTWKSTAKLTLDAYQNVISSH